MIDYLLKNKEGVISVKILIVLTGIITLSLIMLNLMIQQYGENQLYRLQSLQENELLGQMDGYLLEHYGLFGVEAYEVKSYINTKQFPVDLLAVTITPKHSLKEPEVIKKQIVDFMVYRLPINFLDQLLTRFEIIKSADNSKNAIDMKSGLDTAFSSLEQLIDKRIFYTVEINNFSVDRFSNQHAQLVSTFHRLKTAYDEEIEALNIQSMKLETAKKAYDSFYDLYVQKEAISPEDEMKLSQLKEALDLEQNRYDLILYTINELKGALKDLNKDFEKQNKRINYVLECHKSLIKTLKFITEKQGTLDKLCDTTKSGISKLEGIEPISEGIFEEIDNLKAQVNDPKWQNDQDEVLKSLQDNIIILEKCQLKLPLDFMSRVPKVDFQGYRSNFYDFKDERQKEPNPEDQAYYDKQKEMEASEPDVDYQGIVIEEQLKEDTGDSDPSFFSAHKILSGAKNILDQVMINEYILSSFSSFAEASAYDYDFFDKYNKDSYFKRGEIEYILYGKDNEGKNISLTIAKMFSVRVALNAIHVYMDKDKMLFSNSIATGVAGWTGFGVPLVSNIIRVGWSIGESLIDMKKLLKGQAVAVIKVYPEEWELDVGLIKPEGKRSSLEFTYHDYLRVFLITLKEETKLRRLIHLIELNLYKAGKTYQLDHYYTSFDLQTDIEVKGIHHTRTIEVNYE